MGPLRTLNICNIDAMAYKLLLPWLKGLQRDAAEVHVACCCGPYAGQLKAEGVILHDIPMRRRWNPFAHFRALVEMVRVLRSEFFDVVIVHSAVGATVGRFACLLTGTRPVMYVVHGMFVTENTRLLARIVYSSIEKILSFVTNTFQFVSQEDLVATRRSGLVKERQQSAWGCGGVSVDLYRPDAEIRQTVRERCGIPAESIVVGIVARIVREKGFREFFEMAREVAKGDHDVTFLVVGDSLPSDRDGISTELRQWVLEEGIEQRFVFTGHTDSVGEYLKAMDIFALPTYREGFPRSVLEAMATGLPVVATNVRGCREAVVDGDTGILVPAKDSVALRAAVLCLIKNDELRHRMGDAGRRRVVANFDEKLMTDLFVQHVMATISEARQAAASAGIRSKVWGRG